MKPILQKQRKKTSHVISKIKATRKLYVLRRDLLLERLEYADANNVHAQTKLLKEFSQLNNMIQACDDLIKLLKES